MNKLVAVLFAACLGATPIGTAFAQERPEVQELANRWTAAYNRADGPALADLYAEDAEVYIHNEGRYVGVRDIASYWSADMGVGNPITVLTVTDSVTDEEMMLVHGNYQVIDRSNGLPLSSGRFAHIWVLNGGRWLLDRDVWLPRDR